MNVHLRYIAVFLSALLLCGKAAAQAKIGDNKKVIQPGSLLELETTNKGLLNIRLNTPQMLSIPVTAASHGMMVYNTDSACLCLYDGSAWRNMCRGKAHQEKVIYTAAAGDSLFLCPEVVYDDSNVQVFRNGVQVNFSATLGTRQIRLEPEAICRKDDEIKIVQIVIQ